jgi:transcriptional regulator with XRE-family HTH domain
MSLEKYVLKEYFAINLKWYRFSKGYTQEKLAELSNSTPKYISDLERGKFSPSLAKIEDIAKALDIEPYMLLKSDHIEEGTDLPERINSKI